MVLSCMSMEGMGHSLAVEGATNSEILETYLERMLAPMLRKRLGNGHGQPLGPQRRARWGEQRGWGLLYLRSYSPVFNPIEEAFSKIKGL
jgi:transposase